MENEQKATDAETTPVTPTATPQATNPVANTDKKKPPVWAWILGGCLIIAIITAAIFGFLGYWGFKKAKHEINRQKPGYEQFQKDMEQAGKDAQEWQKQADEIQKSMPTPEDLKYPMPE